MSPSLAIHYSAPPTVSRFMDSDARRRVVVGPIGSGKSTGCIMEILRRACEQDRGPDGLRRTRFAVIRNTYRQLKDTTRKTFEEWIDPALGEWKEQDFTFHISFSDVRCEVLFRALDTASDVKKVLSLELTGAYFNELREIPKEIFDGVQGRCGRFPPKRAGGGPTWRGVWGDTNPWPTTHWGYKLFNEQRPKGFALFEQPGGLAANAENVENLIDGYYADLCEGKDQEWIDEYVHGKYPTSDRGSVYGPLIQALKERGGLCAFEHGADGCFLFADLGISDSFALWWMRFGPERGIDVVDHYEAHGRPLSHYFDVIQARGWGLTKVFLPHDARQRNLVTGGSVQDEFEAAFPGQVVIGPPHSVADGLQASRWVLEQKTTRIHTRCQLVTGPEDIDGVGALAAYCYEYDEDRKVYKKTPLHNWASHSADGFRYLAVAARFSEYMTRPPPPPKAEEPLGPVTYSMPALSSIRRMGGRL